MKFAKILVLFIIPCILSACSTISDDSYLLQCEDAYKTLKNETAYHYIITNEFVNEDAQDIKETETWYYQGNLVSYGTADDVTQWTAVIDSAVYLRTIYGEQDQGWQKGENVSVSRPWDADWEDLELIKAVTNEVDDLIYIECKTATSDAELGVSPITFCFKEDRLMALIYRDTLIDATDTQWDVTWTYRFMDTTSEEISKKVDSVKEEIIGN